MASLVPAEQLGDFANISIPVSNPHALSAPLIRLSPLFLNFGIQLIVAGNIECNLLSQKLVGCISTGYRRARRTSQ